jgi:hypothetical protein
MGTSVMPGLWWWIVFEYKDCPPAE